MNFDLSPSLKNEINKKSAKYSLELQKIVEKCGDGSIF